MEIKKTPKADLENKKSIFWEMGLMIAVGAVLLAFEWKSSPAEVSEFITVSEIPMEEDMVPITQMNLPKPPPPPSLKAFEMLEIVEEVNDIDEELEVIDAEEDSENKEVNITDLDYTVETSDDEILPFLPIEDMPVFPGNIQKWLSKNVHYPTIAVENNIEGKVYVQFVVEKDGSVSNVKIVRSVDASLDKEAIRVISSMPKWKPGMQRHKPVRVSYTLPISFQLSKP